RYDQSDPSHIRHSFRYSIRIRRGRGSRPRKTAVRVRQLPVGVRRLRIRLSLVRIFWIRVWNA
ncbi:hypothetical protein PMAYCL1PPCAC_19347, partial [Pristionchus mayeri]